MAREKLPTGQARLADVPSHVSITVTVVSSGRARRMREIRARLTRGRWSLIAGVALAAVVASIAVVAAVPGGGRTNPVTRDALGCVSVGVALHDPRFGRPDFDRRLRCVRDLR